MEFDEKRFAGERYDADLTSRQYSSCLFNNCQFVDMALQDVVFSNCEFTDCTFRNVNVSGLSMQNSIFHACACIGIDWSEVRRAGKLFPLFKEFRGCTLKFNNFFKMKLPKTVIIDSSLLDCGFMECDLSSSVFRNVDFQDTTFQDCDLSKADFREARNYRINTFANRVGKAKFSLPEVIGLLDNLGVIIE
ncbi:MAG: pentapeptide repeat-containing protein [Planctomycetes bacterium]|nr:pentapeptide repeat-containing protein [Planctomycetota bacterium]